MCAAIAVLGQRVHNKPLAELVADWGATWRYLVADSQLRWVGPEKGIIHLALGALVNALWDLWARTLRKPVWKVVADMSPEEVVMLVDWRYIEDAITKEEAVDMLRKAQEGKAERIKEAENNKAVPAYTTSAGWLGYDKAKMKRLLEETRDSGYKHFKMKVGTSLEQDTERLTIAREVIGYDKGNVLMVDANQVGTLSQSISSSSMYDCYGSQMAPVFSSIWTKSNTITRFGLFPKLSNGWSNLHASNLGLLKNLPHQTMS